MMQPPNPADPTPPPLSPLSGGGDGEGDGSKLSDLEYVSRFPPGYRFRPTDKECIVEYLAKKINNEPLPPNLINTVQLYAYTPDHLSQAFTSAGEGVWYFFTPREKKHKTSKRPDRTAGDGRWRAITTDEKIFHNGSIIGSRRTLAYMKGKSNGIKTDWLMHEFTVINSNTTQENSMRLDDWVLCKVYKRRNYAGTRKTGAVVAEESIPQKIKSSIIRSHKEEENRTMAYNEAVQLSVESSACPSASSPGIEAALLAYPYNQIRPTSESEAPYGNIYEEAYNGGGFDNAAMHQHVESYHQIPTAASSNVLDVPLPSYPQQMLNFPSESCYWSADHLIGQQVYDQFNGEQPPLPQSHVECSYPYSYQQRYSCSSHTSSLLPLSYFHQQEPAFEPESENEMECFIDDIFR